MKKFTIILCCFAFSFVSAQNQMFVHTAAPTNTSGPASVMDHPELNSNPNAKLLVSHNGNPPGSSGVFNNHATGLFYDFVSELWGVYNEDESSMVDESSYNVYIAQENEVFVHIADIAHQGVTDYLSVIDHPDLNNNPGATIILSTYFTPNSLTNNNLYGVAYDNSLEKWLIYTEDFAPIPLDSAFFVGISGGLGVSVKHQATSANIVSNGTVIDHPLLNGNPDARFVFTHNYTFFGPGSEQLLPHILGAAYTSTNWAIFIEDLSPMTPLVGFNLFIFDPTLGTPDNSLQSITLYPNPSNDFITISGLTAKEAYSIYSITGKKIISGLISNNEKKDIQTLASGMYFLNFENGNTLKFIKE